AVVTFRLHPDDRLEVHPEVVANMRMGALYARLAHVSLHAALGAFVRRRGRELARWNLAHDRAIAPLLHAAGLPSGPVVEGAGALPHGSAAEDHYARLSPGSAPEPGWCDLFDAPPPPAPPATGSVPPANAPTEAGLPSPQRDVAAPVVGSDDTAAENIPQQHAPTELGDTPAQASVSPTPRPDAPPSAQDKARALQWQMRLLSALEEEARSGGRTFGHMPAWLQQLVQAAVEPPAHWSVVLQRVLGGLSRTGRSYMRPSRRTSALAAVEGHWPALVTMPGRRIQPLGRLAVVVDTSASISNHMLARFVGTVAAIATAEGIDDVRLMCADAVVTSDETLFAAELSCRQLVLSGRGGSDFRAPLRRLSEDAVAACQPFTVVYLSDLEGRFPEEEATAGLSLLWVVPPGCRGKPPFGAWVRLSPA
ncbi:MAG TPA: hypothetical protein ENK23_04140, partial [Sorangium sp.]|nr:hypothetical protein [Sorangium sp.]